MKVLRTIRRVLALAVALWTLAVTVFFLFFAKGSFESTTASQTLGGSLVTATNSGKIPWLSQVEPFTVAVMISFSLLLAAVAAAEWRGLLGVVVPLCFIALVVTFITGFSIGGLYFPGTAVAFMNMLLLAVEKLANRQNHPTV